MKKTFLLLVGILFFNAINIYSQADVSDAIERRLEISGRLDSLELEKQRLKREGKSIKELDELSAALRDSIELLRDNMPIITEEDVQKSKGETIVKAFPLKPKSLFDWLIIGAGAAALLSGIVLIFGIVSSVKKKKRAPAQAATLSQKMSSPRNGLMDIPITNDKPLNLPKEQPKQDLESINKLREKIQAAQPTVSASPFDRAENARPSMPPAATPVSSPPAASTSTSAGTTSKRDIKAEIINAARSGMSEAEIAKRYQVSVDQVALVIKMSDGSLRGA